MARCGWATDDLLAAYHDLEWGTPNHDDRALFEFLVLESAQSGLSWRTILTKRPGYRRCFADFDAYAVAQFGEEEVARLMADPGIVRNRRKITSAIGNAARFLEVEEEFGTFAAYLWGFTDGAVIHNRPRSLGDVPASSALSEALAKDLRRRGFSFVGPVVCYSYLQAVGVIDDHLVTCPRSKALGS